MTSYTVQCTLYIVQGIEYRGYRIHILLLMIVVDVDWVADGRIVKKVYLKEHK